MNKENKEPRDEQGKPHEYWERHYTNGQLAFKGWYIHGKRYGLWEDYHSNGKLSYKGYFIK